MNQTDKNTSIRAILPEEYPLMEDFMYEAIYHPNPANPYPKEVIYYPQVRVYWDNWGQEKDDHCLLALVDDTPAGAVWIRTFRGEIKGCGYVSEQTPEIAVALFEEYRGRGIGTELMCRMIRLMKDRNFKQVSLSISKGNRAFSLYRRLGFRMIDENKEDYIMLLDLA